MKKKLSIVLGLALAVAILMGFMVPFAGASSVSVEVLNPLAEFAIQENQPLTSRDRFYDADGNLNLNGKRIGTSAYSKVGNANGLGAFMDQLVADFPGLQVATTAQSPALGSPWNPKSTGNYTSWANLDAVIFGIAD